MRKDGEGKEAVASDRASECFLVSVDMWKAGRGKVMLVPKARYVDLAHRS